MSTVSPPRPPGTATDDARGAGASRRPRWLRPAAPETDQQRADRLRLRRRLALWSLPVVVVLLLVATKLFSTVAFGEDAVRSYTAGNITGTQDAADHLAFGNVIEPHKAPFALGDARVLAGDFAGARGAFEEALTRAPKDSIESCQIRVNLVLSLEKLATAATSARPRRGGPGVPRPALPGRVRGAPGLLPGRRPGRRGPAAARRPAAGPGAAATGAATAAGPADQQNQQNRSSPPSRARTSSSSSTPAPRTTSSSASRPTSSAAPPSGPSVAKPW